MAFLRTSRKIVSVCSSTSWPICESVEGIFCGRIPIFKIKDIERNASMKYSTRFTANTRVIRCVVIKDCNTDVFVPH